MSSPISTYSKIAVSLGVSLSDLFQEEKEKTGCVIVRKSQRKPVSLRQTAHGYRFESLGHRWPNTDVNPFVLVYLPGRRDARPPNFTFEGEEFIFLLEGELEMFYGGKSHRLGPGDCVFLNGRVPHGGRAVGTKQAITLLISIPRRE